MNKRPHRRGPRAGREEEDHLRQMQAKLRNLTYSTAFSGIDAPGTAISLISSALASLTNCADVRHPQHVSAIECDNACQEELLAHPSPPSCLFSDITSFLTPLALGAVSAGRASGDLTLTSSSFWSRSSSNTDGYSYCRVHKKRCKFSPGRLHACGSPCIDFSPLGLRRRADGKSAESFVSWATLMRRTKPTIMVHENSDHFNIEILESAFSDMYVISSTIICPSQFGWPIRRKRRWTLLLHKRSVALTHCTLDNVIALVVKPRVCTWHVFMVATDEDVESELRWSASRPASQWSTLREPMGPDYAVQLGDHRAALTSEEESFLSQYEASNLPDDCVVNVTQDTLGLGMHVDCPLSICRRPIVL
eukprot:7633657-Pyramimonas_sp.AAC.2